MAFKPVTANTRRRPFVTVAVNAGTGTRSLALSATVRRAIGEPRAVAFEWDQDGALLRIAAASPASPEASRLPVKDSSGVHVTTLLRELGIEVPETTRIDVTQDGPLAVIADLSQYRTD